MGTMFTDIKQCLSNEMFENELTQTVFFVCRISIKQIGYLQQMVDFHLKWDRQKYLIRMSIKLFETITFWP